MRGLFLAIAFCGSALLGEEAKTSVDFEAVRAGLRSFVEQHHEELGRKVPTLLNGDCCGKKGDPIAVFKDGWRILGSWLVLAQDNFVVAGYSYRTWGDGERGRWEHEERVDVVFEFREGVLTIDSWQIGMPEEKEPSHLPEKTPGRRPPATGDSSPGAPQR